MLKPVFFYEHVIERIQRNPGIAAQEIATEFEIPLHAAEMGFGFAKKMMGIK